MAVRKLVHHVAEASGLTVKLYEGYTDDAEFLIEIADADGVRIDGQSMHLSSDDLSVFFDVLLAARERVRGSGDESGYPDGLTGEIFGRLL